MRIRVNNHWRSTQGYIAPGDYDSEDPALLGMGEYLIKAGDAHALPEDIPADLTPSQKAAAGAADAIKQDAGQAGGEEQPESSGENAPEVPPTPEKDGKGNEPQANVPPPPAPKGKGGKGNK